MDFYYHPFTEPAVMPCTRYFWANNKNPMEGRGWPVRPSYTGFAKLMDILNERVVATQSLTGLEGLPHTQGANHGPLWDRGSAEESPLPPFTFGETTLRYPVWDNYLSLARVIETEINADKHGEGV